MKKLKNMLRSQKGLTLIELLAVVVILAIVSAIAIPSIANLIDNNKKDAHAANATQMVNAAKIAVLENQDLHSGTVYLSLDYLVKEGYLEPVADPDKGSYEVGTYEKDTTTGSVDDKSVVTVKDGKVEAVKLENKGKKARRVSAEINKDSKILEVNRSNVEDVTSD